MYIYKNAKMILTGNRNIIDGLWDIQIPSQTNKNTNHPLASPTLQANAILKKKLPKHYLADYLHACAFSPTLPTFNKVIKNGQFLSWPSIEKINFNKFLTAQTATHLGHTDQERSNLQSTKLQQHIKDDFFPQQEDPKKKQFTVCSKLVPFSPKELSYRDLIGSFPFTSSRGNKYLYVMYDFDSDSILVHPLKSRQASEITTAWKTLHGRLTKMDKKSQTLSWMMNFQMI